MFELVHDERQPRQENKGSSFGKLVYWLTYRKILKITTKSA